VLPSPSGAALNKLRLQNPFTPILVGKVYPLSYFRIKPVLGLTGEHEEATMPRTSPPYDVLRQVLIESRIARGLTQQALAKKLGRQQSFIGKIENASRNIDVIEFIEVARALDMDPARLLAKVVKAAYPK